MDGHARLSAFLLALAPWLPTAHAQDVQRAEPSAPARDVKKVDPDALRMPAGEVGRRLQALDPVPLPADLGVKASDMVWEDLRGRLREANRRETKAWRGIHDAGQWAAYVRPRIDALRRSLGKFPDPPEKVRVEVTGRIEGDGYRIHNVVFETRPGLLASANLYLPAAPVGSMPGVLICHSHHNPRTQGELQDMGVLWARLGCAVLVMDQLGHGERRQHPFPDEKSFPKEFRAGRQDYYFRYNVGLQLHTVGESLIGWMAWDLMRGVDVLLAQPGVDASRVILLGAVAGGGDPAAVAAALDGRIACAVPFNFGGPQPETRFPLPEDADEAFNYAGSGSWESTRNLRLSARDGFLPWVIVGSVAPRKLVYAHEFAWDKDRDPVWQRLRQIYAWYDRPGNLSAAHGSGSVRGQPPESTHCNNIGEVHRRQIYPALQKWFGIPAPEAEPRDRRDPRELQCFTPKLRAETQPVWKLARDSAEAQAADYLRGLEKVPAGDRRGRVRRDWAGVLGTGVKRPDLADAPAAGRQVGFVWVEDAVIRPEPGRAVAVPVTTLVPLGGDGPRPVVVAVAQEGRAGLLKNRTKEIVELLKSGVAVCLPDLRGTGATSPGADRGRQSAATSLSATELMLGGTMTGRRCHDLRAVLHYLRTNPDVDAKALVVWGESFAAANPPDADLEFPLGIDGLPPQSEPTGPLVAVLTALLDGDVRAVLARGGLASYRSVLDSPFCYLPHDAVVPGATAVGDLPAVALALAPLPVRIEGAVNGRNQVVPAADLQPLYAAARAAYRRADAGNGLEIADRRSDPAETVRWLVRHAQRGARTK